MEEFNLSPGKPPGEWKPRLSRLWTLVSKRLFWPACGMSVLILVGGVLYFERRSKTSPDEEVLRGPELAVGDTGQAFLGGSAKPSLFDLFKPSRPSKPKYDPARYQVVPDDELLAKAYTPFSASRAGPGGAGGAETATVGANGPPAALVKQAQARKEGLKGLSPSGGSAGSGRGYSPSTSKSGSTGGPFQASGSPSAPAGGVASKGWLGSIKALIFGRSKGGSSKGQSAAPSSKALSKSAKDQLPPPPGRKGTGAGRGPKDSTAMVRTEEGGREGGTGLTAGVDVPDSSPTPEKKGVGGMGGMGSGDGKAKEDPEKLKADCEDKGGKWDAGRCSLDDKLSAECSLKGGTFDAKTKICDETGAKRRLCESEPGRFWDDQIKACLQDKQAAAVAENCTVTGGTWLPATGQCGNCPEGTVPSPDKRICVPETGQSVPGPEGSLCSRSGDAYACCKTVGGSQVCASCNRSGAVIVCPSGFAGPDTQAYCTAIVLTYNPPDNTNACVRFTCREDQSRRCEFRKGDVGCTNTNGGQFSECPQVQPPAATASGQLTASPNPCQVAAGQNSCDSNVTWSASGAPAYALIVRRSQSTGASCVGASGNMAVPAVEPGKPAALELYAVPRCNGTNVSGGTLIGSVQITATARACGWDDYDNWVRQGTGCGGCNEEPQRVTKTGTKKPSATCDGPQTANFCHWDGQCAQEASRQCVFADYNWTEQCSFSCGGMPRPKRKDGTLQPGKVCQGTPTIIQCVTDSSCPNPI